MIEKFGHFNNKVQVIQVPSTSLDFYFQYNFPTK